ncbi:hypothetical protein J4210_06210 [Candidatus Woesearchaeota archaeon]|nr:hypothetical protein [Candidatus Woesearchaeota archaeon]
MVTYPLFTTSEMVRQLEGSSPALFLDASKGQFSPYFAWDRIIPVPGMHGTFSRSVEGIWQGLKIIDGQIDFSLFNAKKVRKRRVLDYPSTRFLHGGKNIDLVMAREVLYKPAYRWMFEHLVFPVFREKIYGSAEEGTQIYCFDVDCNADVTDSSSSFSHASFLTDLINEELERRNGWA